MPVYQVTDEVWRYPGKAGWHFLTLPAHLADELRARYTGAHRPLGSLRVRASLGSTTWSTSLFSDTRSSSYLLPIKAQVCRRERIQDGDTAAVQLDLDD